MVYYHFFNIQEFLQNCQIQTHLIQKFEFNEKTRCQLFDIYVESVISYGSEIWSFHKSPEIERSHHSYCKNVLGDRRNVCNYMIYCELGRCPLILQRKLNFTGVNYKKLKIVKILTGTCVIVLRIV